MGRIGFWGLLVGNMSYWEREAINGVYDRADSLLDANQQLEKRLAQMSREIVMLRTAVTVLVNTLRDTNVVDPQLLDARLEAALDEALPAPEPIPAAGAPKPPPPVHLLVCIRCRTETPAASTTMTADGPICDSCGV
ncbi:MAG: hypothetical protein ABI867_38375 [Kofleriaceae bacterium]